MKAYYADYQIHFGFLDWSYIKLEEKIKSLRVIKRLNFQKKTVHVRNFLNNNFFLNFKISVRRS